MSYWSKWWITMFELDRRYLFVFGYIGSGNSSTKNSRQFVISFSLYQWKITVIKRTALKPQKSFCSNKLSLLLNPCHLKSKSNLVILSADKGYATLTEFFWLQFQNWSYLTVVHMFFYRETSLKNWARNSFSLEIIQHNLYEFFFQRIKSSTYIWASQNSKVNTQGKPPLTFKIHQFSLVRFSVSSLI